MNKMVKPTNQLTHVTKAGQGRPQKARFKKNNVLLPEISNKNLFRHTPHHQDIANVEALLQTTDFFHPYEINVGAELVKERLAKGQNSGYEFVFFDGEEGLAGYSCYGVIPCTLSSYDIYWIAVHPDLQRKGLGRSIYCETEFLIQKAQGTRIYIETSQSEKYLPTRKFYKSVGFKNIALLKDFFAPGDGKVIYCKILS